MNNAIEKIISVERNVIKITRIVSLALLVLSSTCNVFAQSIFEQKGVAYRYNGKKLRIPLGGVYIKAATSPNGVVSQEQNGRFVLKLKNIGLGDVMGNVIVQKTGMMVFNKEEVSRWSVRREPLVLVVCDASEFQKQKNNLISIGRSLAEKKYQKQLANIEQKNKALQLTLDQYYAKLDSIEKEKNNALAHMDEYADMFARIDESDIDTLAQKAMELFRQGYPNEATKLFEQGNYLKKIDNALKIKAQAEDLRHKADSAEVLADNDIEEYKKNIKAQIAVYKMNNEWNGAGELLKGLADKLQTLDAVFDYAVFAQEQNLFTEAEKEYNLLVRLILSKANSQTYEPNLAMVYDNLAVLYSDTQRFSEAEQMHNAALEIYKRLAETNPQVYEPYLAQSYNNLALLYNVTQRFNEAELMYKSAMKIQKHLAESDPQAYESVLAVIYNNLAILYKKSRRFNEAEQMYGSALQTYKCLAENNPQTYEPVLAKAYINLANLYMDTGCSNKAEQMYKPALEKLKRLAEANPQAYEPDLANGYNNFANLYTDTRCFNEAEQMHKKALKIRKRLAEANPQAYEPDLANSYNNLASLYGDTRRFSEAEQMYKVALEIRKRLAEANPQVYEPDLAVSYSNLANLYGDTRRFNEAEQMYTSALEIYKRLAEANPQVYEPGLVLIYNDLALLYNDAQRFNEAELKYKSALEICKRLAEADPQAYKSKLTVGYINVAFMSIFTKQFAQAERYSIEALKVDSTIHSAYTNLAAALLFQGRCQEAEKIYRQYKPEMKESFLSDFEEFVKAGVVPKNREKEVEKVKQMLLEN